MVVAFPPGRFVSRFVSVGLPGNSTLNPAPFSDKRFHRFRFSVNVSLSPPSLVANSVGRGPPRLMEIVRSSPSSL